MQKKVSYGGLGCALCVLLITMSAYLPTLKAATLFAASIIPYVVCCLSSVKIALAMYGATSILAFLICQAGSPAIVAAFIICFGNYPIIRYILGKRGRTFRNTAKLVLYALYALAVYFVFTKVLLIPIIYSPIILFILGAAVFYFYDFLLVQTARQVLSRLNNRT